MLEVSKQGQKTIVAINYSSLELINTCPKKAYYSLVAGLRDSGDSPALSFGSCFHKFLEHFYQLPAEARILLSESKEAIGLYAFGHGLDTLHADPVAESVRLAVAEYFPVLSLLPESDKRSLENLTKIAMAYVKTYKDDGLDVATDSEGKPYTERSFEFTIHDSPDLQIRYHGTIDVILRNRVSGLYMIADHKTTHALGQEFYARCKPNHQYTGYVLGAQRCLGIDTELFLVNGIQVAKTKQEFARQITTRTTEDFEELRIAVVSATKRWLEFVASGEYPMNAPNPCSMYGSCQYLQVCEVPASLKESVIRSKWPKAE